MEFSVTKSALLNELNTTQGVVERKTTIPILSNILVEAKGTRLTITATDLELSIRTSCEAKIKKEGAGTIPAKKLLELVRLLPEGEIRFRLLENHWVEIVSRQKEIQTRRHGQGKFPRASCHAARNGKDTRGGPRKPHRQNQIRNFHGRIALHPERRPAHPQARYRRHGRHRRPPLGPCRNRPKNLLASTAK